jgi:hypothetical protein
VIELKTRIKQLCEENLSITNELHCGKEIFQSFSTQQHSATKGRPVTDDDLLKTKEEEIAMLWNMVKNKSKSVLRDASYGGTNSKIFQTPT